MALSKPGGRFDGPISDKPGGETKARSGSSYQSGVKAGFGLNSGVSIDAPAESPKSPTMVGKDKMPNTELGGKAVNK